VYRVFPVRVTKAGHDGYKAGSEMLRTHR